MELAKGSNRMLATNSDADSAFEPTIDELVNDFDDEQTLREEEALAAIENPLNDPLDEIEALREESEMPLEELLAKYALPPGPAFRANVEPRRKRKKTSSRSKKRKNKSKSSRSYHEVEIETRSATSNSVEIIENEPPMGHINDEPEIITIDSGDDDVKEETREPEHENRLNQDISDDRLEDESSTAANNKDKPKIRRSHLFELYPDQNFDDAIAAAHGGAIRIETLYSEDEEEEDIDEEEETDPDYIKKTIMVGSAFQAVIPGLSQYGDVLPYENEDKLVWEPSQVSEAEVEEYLLKIRDIKPSLSDDESVKLDDDDMTVTSSEDVIILESDDEQKTQRETIKSNSSTPVGSEIDTGVVKDNEQALHLLVQCGYDFKEALRRKRLNSVPLIGESMSLWSEEECQKFEEGIQKFGKDFLKIRQNQVRTRTMRELVQFYYLWKKSERRDHNFANADTVDHMDMYLNEGEDYGTSSGNIPFATASSIAPCRKLNGCNFSIMTCSQIGTSPTKINNGNVSGKKRTLNDCNASLIQTKNNIGNNHDQTSMVPMQSASSSQPK